MATIPVFPTALFAFNDQEIDIEKRTVTGGMSVSGEEDVIATDGGGRWFAEFQNGPLLAREHTMAWRALKALLDDGATPVIVPFCDPMHQPNGGSYLVPHSDDSEFSDDTEYEGGASVMAAASAPLRATRIDLDLAALDDVLIGGETFAIEHLTKGWRAYRVATVEAQTATTATITFRPPLRAAVAYGEPVDFRSPRCLMRADGRAPSALNIGRYGDAAIRFVEAP